MIFCFFLQDLIRKKMEASFDNTSSSDRTELDFDESMHHFRTMFPSMDDEVAMGNIIFVFGVIVFK